MEQLDQILDIAMKVLIIVGGTVWSIYMYRQFRALGIDRDDSCTEALKRRRDARKKNAE